MTEKPAIKIAIDPASKRELKALGGGDRDQWNERLLNLVTRALPVSQEKIEAVSHVGSAVMAGVVDMNPTHPIEGVLISQLVVANEAALSLYRRAWACNPADYFDAHAKNLQLADKASRTVAMLTERLDQHRGRGQTNHGRKAPATRGRRAILGRAIAPATTAFQYLHNAADDAAITQDGHPLGRRKCRAVSGVRRS